MNIAMSTATPVYVTATPGIWHKCGWDGVWFEFSHGNDKYCSDRCKAEAQKEQKRAYKKRNYWKWRKEIRSKDLGTLRLGMHRYEDFTIEERVIRRERNRILFSTLISKRHQQSGHPLGVMVTHPYATSQDYFTHSLNLLVDVPVSKCVECNSQSIYKDYARAEVVCTSCGLVLHGPPADGIKYPWLELIQK